jgi:uncharacterized protein (TIGR02246 family)
MTGSERLETIHSVPEDESDIRALVSRLGDAWNLHDPPGIVQDFAAEIEHVSVRGHWQHTRSELEATYRRNHAGIWAEVTYHPTVEQLRFLRPDVAVVIVHGTFRSPDAPEEIARSMWVVSKEAGRWVLRAFQQTYVQNIPITPRAPA